MRGMPSAIERQPPPHVKFFVEYVLFRLLENGVEIQGRENIPKQGPAIIVINHMGWAEFFLPAIFLSKLPTTMSRARTFDYPVLGALIRQLWAIPVNRGQVDRQALAQGMQTLRQGGFFVTSPEGTRGRERDGTRRILKQAKNGVIYMAKKAAAELKQPIPISPWAVWGGTEWLLPEIDDNQSPLKDKLMYKRKKVYLKVAPPFLVQLPPPDQPLTHRYLQPKSDALMVAIRDMLPPEYAGYYRGKQAVAAAG